MIVMENALYFINYDSTFSPGFYTKGSCLTKPGQAFAGSQCTLTKNRLRLSTLSTNQQGRAWNQPLSPGA